jgi:Helicase conserved C-terminal domain
MTNSALGERIRTIFVDEFHDLYAPHPERQRVWERACLYISQLSKQLVFVSATHPPHLDSAFFRKARISSRTPPLVIRASTDRPELAHYVLSLAHSSIGKKLWLSTIRLVKCLTELLATDERILVFFESCTKADDFSRDTSCAVYHSKLPTIGNTKAHNLNLWDSGTSPVMAATTAAGQGVDRPHVRFILIHGRAFGMLPYAQQGGRGGRGGRPSYVIILRDAHSHQICPLKEDVNCIGPFQDYVAHEGLCRRKALLEIMDGKDSSFSCLDKPGYNLCDVCDPNSDMLKIVQAAAIAPDSSDLGVGNHPSAMSSGSGFGSSFSSGPSTLSPSVQMHVGLENGTLAAQFSPGMHVQPSPIVGTTQSHSQPILSSRTGCTLTQPSPSMPVRPFSQPTSKPPQASTGRVTARHDHGVGGFINERANRSNESLVGRRQTSNQLDSFLKIVKGRCPVHFATCGGQLVDRSNLDSSKSHLTSCVLNGANFPFDDYKKFKSAFSYERYAYCYYCGLPQDRDRNGEAPRCHKDAGFGRGPCPWADFPYVVVFSIWHTKGVREEMLAAFQLKGVTAYDEFVAWCTQEHAWNGEFTKMLEVFLWYCRKCLTR